MRRLMLSLSIVALLAAIFTPISAFAETPNDPMYGEQWYLEATNATAIWDYGITGEGVRVGVIDTGIYYGHEDIDYKYVAEGYNYTGGYYDENNEYIGHDNTSDIEGHGTRIASIICAKRGNGLGFSGILSKVTIVPLLVAPMGFAGRDMARAIKDAVEIYNCDVLSISIGASYSSEDAKLIQQAVDYATGKGAIIVAGVGNEGDESLLYPAAFNNVIGVGASERDGSRCDFSNHNAAVFVLAPGRDICTATMDGPDTYKPGSGTSASTPQVSALAAAAKSIKPDLTTDEFKQLLKSTSDDKGAPGWDEYTGWGVIDCKALLDTLMAESDRFSDVSNSWAKESIEFVADKGYFTGVSAHEFEPEANMTRGMLVTVLGRVFESNGGTVADAGISDFADVSPRTWYGKYVQWASANDIVEGYGNGSFCPDINITREQLATILARYAEFTGMDTAASGSLKSFADESGVSSWAKSAMLWAVEKGLINGVEAGGSSFLRPEDAATRAQVAAIIRRYCTAAG